MAAKARYIFIASMDVDPAKEALFNELYDTEHVPLLLKVPGVYSAKRYKREPLTMRIAARTKTHRDRRRAAVQLPCTRSRARKC